MRSVEHPLTSVSAVRSALADHGVVLKACGYGYDCATQDALEASIPLPASLGHAVLKRKVDFLAGRLCARDALRGHGKAATGAVPIGDHGLPVWPRDFIGSISHMEQLAVAGVARRSDVVALGLDVEGTLSGDVMREIARLVASPGEIALGAAQGLDPRDWMTLIFSAKESVFKALFPLTLVYFDFLDIAVTGYDPGDALVRIEFLNTGLREIFRPEVLTVHGGFAEKYAATICVIDLRGRPCATEQPDRPGASRKSIETTSAPR